MHTAQDVGPIAYIALDKGYVVLAVELVHKAVGYEIAVSGGELHNGGFLDEYFVAFPVLLQVTDRDGGNAEAVSEGQKLIGAHHGAVIAHDLAAEATFLKTCQAAQVNGGLGVAAALEHDGEAIGLFRSEFLFMDSPALPSEEEQFAAYQKVAIAMKGAPVIIRTLDVGGDKDIPYLHMEKEENPFMGFRAVRYCLENADQYKVQLRALLRASAFGDVEIMVPLVTCVEEVRAVKALVEECKAELDAEGIAYNKDVKVGVMMETPAASLIADKLAKEADFFSIGTNDLIGYTMCADRGNDHISNLYSVYYPAVLRSIKNIIECGVKEGIMVGMCGEAASDPLLEPLLISFGLDEFSMSAPSVLRARKTISQWSKWECDELADKALACTTAEEVKAILEAAAR